MIIVRVTIALFLNNYYFCSVIHELDMENKEEKDLRLETAEKAIDQQDGRVTEPVDQQNDCVTEPFDSQDGYRKVAIDIVKANVFAVVIMVVAAVVFLVPFFLIWKGRKPIDELLGGFGNWMWVLALMFVGMK